MTTPIGSYSLPPALPTRVAATGSNGSAQAATRSASSDSGPAYKVELSSAAIAATSGAGDHTATIQNHADFILGALDGGYGDMLRSARAAASR